MVLKASLKQDDIAYVEADEDKKFLLSFAIFVIILKTID